MGQTTYYTIGEILGDSAEMSTYTGDLLVTPLLIRMSSEIPLVLCMGDYLMGLILMSLVSV